MTNQKQIDEWLNTSDEFKAGILYACLRFITMLDNTIDGKEGDEKLLRLGLEVTRLGMASGK